VIQQRGIMHAWMVVIKIEPGLQAWHKTIVLISII